MQGKYPGNEVCRPARVLVGILARQNIDNSNKIIQIERKFVKNEEI